MKISFTEGLYVTLNAGILAVVYTALGVFISFVMYYLFDDFDEKWQKRSEQYKLLDVSVEISIIAVVILWSSYYIDQLPPLFAVRKPLEALFDTYILGTFFLFAVFIFLDSLTEKLKYVNEFYLAKHFAKYFPQHGSILDGSIFYSKNE